MERKIIYDLVMENQDIIFDGDLEITGNVEMYKGSINVSGKIIISNPLAKFSVYKGDVIANEIYSLSQSPLIVTGKINVHKNLEVPVIFNNDFINIGGNIHVDHILGKYIQISGDIDASYIIALMKVVIKGNCNTTWLSSHKTIIGGNLYVDSLFSNFAQVDGQINNIGKAKKFKNKQIYNQILNVIRL